jgi:hypothetical protein
MSYWNGAEWVGESAVASRPTTSNRAKWPATIVMIVGLLLILVPMQLASAAPSKSGPSLWTSCGTACRAGASLTVRGSGFIPSAGGQQVFLWIQYPGDYCGDAGCHGFYYDPSVAADGSFSLTFDNLPGSGEGGIKATQWNAKRDKWLQVAYVDYFVN